MRETKDSGIEWIGEIPKEWKKTRGGFIYKIQTGKKDAVAENPQGKYAFFTCSKEQKKTDNYCFDTEALLVAGNGIVGYTQYFKGKFDAYQRTYVLSDFKNINPIFLKYYVSNNLITEVTPKSQGSVIQFIKYDDLKNFNIVLPSLQEQSRIASFLDSKCSEIDSLHSDINEQIETLKEYKKSVITEAVTKGLNPDAEMKDSGIEWIGKIPSHWQVKRFKYAVESLNKGNGITKEDVKDDGNIQCIRYGEIYSKYSVSVSKTFSRTDEEIISSPKHIKYGDILFSGTGELVEEIGKNIVYLGMDPCLAGGDIIIAKHNQEPRFLNYAANSVYMQNQKSFGKAKLKVVHISTTEIGNLLIAFPSLEEQQQIADYLDSKCSEIDSIIESKQQQLETLEQYKKSLIYEYVTGKKEVPNNAV